MFLSGLLENSPQVTALLAIKMKSDHEKRT